MASQTELERVARYVAGDLDANERTTFEEELQVRPELAAAAQRMRELDALAPSLVTPLDEPKIDSLLAGVPRPERTTRGRGWIRLVGAAALGAALTAGVLWSIGMPRVDSELVVIGAPATVDGKELGVGDRLSLTRTVSVRTSGEGGVVVSSSRGTLFVSRSSRINVPREADRTAQLFEGALLASGDGLEVATTQGDVRIRGAAIVSREPSDALLRVTEGFQQGSSGENMKQLWMKLGPPVGAAMVSSGLTVMVMNGSATAQLKGKPAVTISAGERWESGADRPTPIFAGSRPAVASADRDSQTANGSLDAPQDPASLDKPSLVAMVQKLRDEREQLLREKYELKSELDRRKQPTQANRYRIPQADLVAMAEEGRTTYRLPQFEGGKLGYNAQARDDVGLTPQEEKAIAEIYASSGRRLRDGLLRLYREIGGDPNPAHELSNAAILNDLQLKSVGGEDALAIRQAAKERAGLLPAGSLEEGPPLLRAYRLLWREDDRVVSELEQLLGPARAEALLNHRGTGQHVMGLSAGPEKK